MTDMARPMGRPPLSKGEKTKTTAVRMPATVFDRIVALVGPNRMAAFVREAIENELERRERQKPEKLEG